MWWLWSRLPWHKKSSLSITDHSMECGRRSAIARNIYSSSHHQDHISSRHAFPGIPFDSTGTVQHTFDELNASQGARDVFEQMHCLFSRDSRRVISAIDNNMDRNGVPTPISSWCHHRWVTHPCVFSVLTGWNVPLSVPFNVKPVFGSTRCGVVTMHVAARWSGHPPVFLCYSAFSYQNVAQPHSVVKRMLFCCHYSFVEYHALFSPPLLMMPTLFGNDERPWSRWATGRSLKPLHVLRAA